MAEAAAAAPAPAPLPAAEPAGLFVVRYSEIGLKGENRSWFEERLVRNLRDQLHGLAVTGVDRIRGRVVVRHAAPVPDVAERIGRTFGVRSFSPAHRVDASYEAIEAAAVDLALRSLRERTPRLRTFRVATDRSDKGFPIRSMDVSAKVGAAVLRHAPDLKVRMTEPDLEIGIEIHRSGAFVFADWPDGPGGLPVGTSGRVVLLLSGGIDSPVAGHMLQKRGCALAPLYLHAFPFTGDQAKEKVLDLARILALRQTVLDLRVAPFADAQVALRDRCRAELLVILYRRLMMRVAERIARRTHALAIATGESVGQVASQTIPNLLAINAALGGRLPILRPLSGFDKEETIALARRIGTFEVSIRRADDCCSLFVPKHPATRAELAEVLAEEGRVDAEALADACAARVETFRFYRGELQPAEPPAETTRSAPA